MGLTAVPDGCGKSRSYGDSIPRPFSPWRVAVPNELSRLPTHTSIKGKDVPVSMKVYGGSRGIAPICHTPAALPLPRIEPRIVQAVP